MTIDSSRVGFEFAVRFIRAQNDRALFASATAALAELARIDADQFQMQLFAAQVFKHYPEVTRVKTSLVWLKDMAMDTEVYYRSGVNTIWAEVMKRIQRINDSLEHDNWPAKPSGLCRYCPARHNCDYARV